MAGKRHFPATQLFRCCSAVFLLQRSAAFGQMTSAALQKSQCCSAVSAAQHSENCSATSVFACGMLQGRGLEGWGLGLYDICLGNFYCQYGGWGLSKLFHFLLKKLDGRNRAIQIENR